MQLPDEARCSRGKACQELWQQQQQEEGGEDGGAKEQEVAGATHTHTHPPEIPFRARDVLGRGEGRAEDACARAVEGGEGRDLSARLKHSTTDTFSPRNLCKLRCSSSCVRLIIPEFTRMYAC